MQIRKTSIIIPLTIVTVLAAGMLISKNQYFKISRFIPPDTCWGCHDYIYKQWKNSMHSLAHKDPVYRKVSKFFTKGLKIKGEIDEAESCPKCHTPIGFFSGFPKKTSDDHSKTAAIATHGVQCDYCHSVKGNYKPYNNHMIIDPGHGEDNPGTKRGPFKDSESDFHESAFSKFHTESTICGTCHDVRHVAYGTKLETTFEEWQNGPYSKKGSKDYIPCQGCHMYQKPGVPATASTKRPENPGQAADSGPKRKHIFTHYFVGANRYVPSLFGDKLRDSMAKARLQNAADISIGSSLKKGIIEIKITNSGAGHKLPTGLTSVRQMWLEVTVKNSSGKVLFSTGRLDKNGYITDDTILYNTVFGDGKGNPVLNIGKARQVIKDYRIPPGKSLTEKISLKKVKLTKGSIIVTARLLYRSAPQKVLDIVTGKGKVKFPVTEMVKAERKIKI